MSRTRNIDDRLFLPAAKNSVTSMCYASDTTDEEWDMIAPYVLRQPNRRGRPCTADFRAVLDAIFYMAETGCQWNSLPKDFPSPTMVQNYFYRWRDDGTLEAIIRKLSARALDPAGRLSNRSFGMTDSRFVQVVPSTIRCNFSRGMKVKWRRGRCFLVPAE